MPTQATELFGCVVYDAISMIGTVDKASAHVACVIGKNKADECVRVEDERRI